MASERRRLANRNNAGKSTGPKSRTGKKRASQNAYRHGLSAAFQPDCIWIEKLEQLERDIMDTMGDRIDLEQARYIALAQLEVVRVRAAISGAVEQIYAEFGRAEGPSTSASLMELAELLELAETDPGLGSKMIERALFALTRLSRYERRALARRDRAVRRYLDALPQSARITESRP